MNYDRVFRRLNRAIRKTYWPEYDDAQSIIPIFRAGVPNRPGLAVKYIMYESAWASPAYHEESTNETVV